MHRMQNRVEGAGIAIQMRGVRHAYDNAVSVLDGLDFETPAGQFLAILGPSGCGKSTLLRLIAGLDRPRSGSIHAAVRSSGIAYVFQDAHLLPWRSALQNVALPLELMHVPRGRRADAARSALEQVGLSDAMDRFPNQLSGGMRMRVSLARAMVTRPKLLLLDEPFAALDELTRERLDEQLRDLWRASGMTVIFVTHSTTEAAFLAERAIVLSARPARIVEDRAIALPPDRAGAIRATPPFVAEVRALYGALERGEP
ncbi:MAG TPA: ABC transporter ATP-binding protein [Tepidisphaeraceae bacterium]|nr:ABC transporter ATP-binding protein [Tepidisphaeraceae bacterium]